ncbi:MAG: NmrA family NAD(P)-binding protein [Anaerolineae bacterium]|nr:NmrA family NAD(P)-binding protein [Anaerolineae bacterium]
MKVLVAGATGIVGSNLVRQLVGMGHDVRALTRSAARAKFPIGVEVVEGDLTNPASFAHALEGVTGLHLINFGGDDFASLQTGAEIIALAEKAGVKRVTVLGNGQKTSVENAVEASSLAWTLLGPVEFMSNMLEWSYGIKASGLVRQPFASRKTAIVHEADIAAVAAHVLTSDGNGGKTYSITGPEVLTPRDLARIIGEAIGRDVQFVELTPEEARAEWQANGVPPDIIEFMLWVYGDTPEQGYTVTTTVEQVTGRPARTFAEWAAEHAAAFRTEAVA